MYMSPVMYVQCSILNQIHTLPQICVGGCEMSYDFIFLGARCVKNTAFPLLKVISVSL